MSISTPSPEIRDATIQYSGLATPYNSVNNTYEQPRALILCQTATFLQVPTSISRIGCVNFVTSLENRYIVEHLEAVAAV